MSRYVLTKRADRDLDAIWDLIERTNGVGVADRIERELHSAMEMLADHPLMGHQRVDVPNPNYRFWNVYRFVIAYRTDKNRVHVSRVVHGARDFRKLFSESGGQVRGSDFIESFRARGWLDLLRF